jgi:hypothetical protein
VPKLEFRSLGERVTSDLSGRPMTGWWATMLVLWSVVVYLSIFMFRIARARACEPKLSDRWGVGWGALPLSTLKSQELARAVLLTDSKF